MQLVNPEGLDEMHVSDGRFRTTDGCCIAYTMHTRTGRAAFPRMVLIHSLASFRGLWSRLISLLYPHLDILTYDCRGHGQSGHGGYIYSPHQFADDLAELLTHVGWETAIIAGCSMGGCVAIAFAAEHPDKATGLGVIDSTAWFGPDAANIYRDRATVAEREGLRPLLDIQVKRWFSDSFRESSSHYIAPLEEAFLRNDLRCYRGACEMLGDLDLRGAISGLGIPATIVVGENDRATPPAMANVIHTAISGSELTVIKDAGHLTPVERPQEVADALLRLTARFSSP